jgi:hypothetical protein
MNYTETEMTSDQWKIEAGGLSLYKSFNGLVKLSVMKRIETTIPRKVA